MFVQIIKVVIVILVEFAGNDLRQGFRFPARVLQDDEIINAVLVGIGLHRHPAKSPGAIAASVSQRNGQAVSDEAIAVFFLARGHSPLFQQLDDLAFGFKVDAIRPLALAEHKSRE